MSLIRLVMLDVDAARSGLIPSRTIPSVLFAISRGADGVETFWKKILEIDPGLREHFQANEDPEPLLEGIGDGLLVISWEHHCIESFQEFQPVCMEGIAWKHNGTHVVEDSQLEYELNEKWHIIDHYF